MRWYDSLSRRAEIAFVRRRGRASSYSTLTAYVAEPGGSRARFCVTVSSAVGKAVVRNRVRRRIMGALDQLPAPGAPLRAVFVVKPGAGEASYERIAADVARALGART